MDDRWSVPRTALYRLGQPVRGRRRPSSSAGSRAPLDTNTAVPAAATCITALVGDGIFDGPVAGRRAERARVVVCAVHPGGALASCMDHAREGPVRFERARLFDRGERVNECVDLLDRRHLGQCDDEAGVTPSASTRVRTNVWSVRAPR